MPQRFAVKAQGSHSLGLRQHTTQGVRSLGFVLLIALAAPCLAEPIRIDLGMDTGRSDTANPGWTEWQVHDGPEAVREFDGVKVTLRGTGQDNLKGVWHKRVLNTGALVAADGVVVERGGLEIELAGLSPGPHTLVTYHNTLSGPASKSYKIAVEGVDTSTEVMPSSEVIDNADIAGAYVEFTVADKPIAIRIAATDDANVILNGLEIDGSDPNNKATKPSPADLDWHYETRGRATEFGWMPARSAVEHEFYFASDHDPAQARAKVENATLESAFHIGKVWNPEVREGRRPADAPVKRMTFSISEDDNLKTYCWRVDSIDAAGKVTKGDVWSYRPRHLAFPGAEGYGRFAIGGRGGRVIKVTNLNDSGPGSLRAAVEASGPRTVVFDVSGRIDVQSKLIIRDPYLTIAGQTAPGKGICISNYNMGLLGNHDCIIRFMRVRPGNTAGVTLDGMGLASCDHSIIDHCSISWTQDESFSSRGAKNITLQRTLISEALNVAGHKNYEKGKEHGYAASISGDIGSFHHNLLAHCAGRNWSLAGGLDKATRHAGRLDLRNNVVYNWGHRTTDGGAKEVNFVSNYYKPGAATRVFHVLMPEREAVKQFGPQMYYAAGNVMEGRFGAENQLEGIFERRGEPHENWLVDEPFFDSHVTTTSAEAAFKDVLSDVGCNQPMLDEHDQRIIDETLHGEARYQGSITGHPGLPDTQDDVGGWEDYGHETRAADWDPDNDGLPTWWEKLHGLNPNSPADDFSDANGDPDGDGYTNLEDYLNWLAVPHYECRVGESLEIDLARYARGYDAENRTFKLSAASGGEVTLKPGSSIAVFKPNKAGLGSFFFEVADTAGDGRTSQINVRVVE